MGDSAEDKEKAEKVAAARKRYEKLKKQKNAKTTKAKKEDKADAAEEVEDETNKPSNDKDKDDTTATAEDEAIDDDREPDDDPVDAHNNEKDNDNSQSLQSQMRSDSFRRASPGASLMSPLGMRSPPLNADAEVQEIYKKQAARIEQLEAENKRLEKEAAASRQALKKTEGHVEEMQEGLEDVAELRVKAGRTAASEAEAEKLKGEVSTLQRQVTNLQSAASQSKRRQSSTSVPTATSLTEEYEHKLASKTSTIEYLELELSNLRHSTTTEKSELENKIQSLESSLQTAEDTSRNAKQQLDDLKKSLEDAKDTSTTSDKGESENRILLLTSDLKAAQTATADAAKRSEALEKKIATLSTLHREAEARTATQTSTRKQELEEARQDTHDLRKRLSSITNENTRLRELQKRHVEGDSGGVEELEDEARDTLLARIRELEGEVYDLRRGVWRERRREIDDATSPGTFDEVDLAGTPLRSPSGGRRDPFAAFSVSNVINTFTGGNQYGAGRRASVKEGDGLEEFEDDMEFDESAFRKAKEEKDRARLERVRETKRKLPEWRGWRVDISSQRGGVAAGVFEM